MRSFFTLSILFIVVLLPVGSVSAQTDSTVYTAVIPGKEFKAGWFHKFLFGDHWRNIWTQPVKVKVLNLDKFAGGLKPAENNCPESADKLILTGGDGKKYIFKPISKDASVLLPEEYGEIFTDNILYDQVSSVNPFAPVIVAGLLKAVNLVNDEPEIFVMPDDKSLGKYRVKFGGKTGFLARSSGPLNDCNNLSDADYEIKRTGEIFNYLENNQNNKIDDTGFLKTRLMDILVGDWNNNPADIKWLKQNDLWRPVQRERERAFIKYDGLAPMGVEFIGPFLPGFNYGYPGINNFTSKGRDIDRRFLTGLNKSVWDSVTNFITNNITDSVIVASVKKMPEEDYRIAGDDLISKLINRRNNLSEISRRYYELINKVSDVYGSSKKEYLLVNRINDDSTSVKIYDYKNIKKYTQREPYFSKIFETDYTDEIRIYMLGGDDKVIVKGTVNEGPLVRVIGGNGKDTFIDSSEVKGYFLSVIPVPDAENKTRFYDKDKNTNVTRASGTVYDDSGINRQNYETGDYRQRKKDRGTEWTVYPLGGFNSDDGLLIGAGFGLYSYNFRKIPYEYYQSVEFLYATLPNSYSADYSGRFIDVLPGMNFRLDIRKSALSFTKYFGYGNELELNKTLYDNDYYRLKQENFYFYPHMEFKLNDYSFINIGPFYESNQSSLSNPELLNSFKYGNYGTGWLESVGVNSSLNYDSRDNTDLPYKGFYFNTEINYYSKLFDIDDNYIRANFDIRKYLSFDMFEKSTLAVRAGGGKVWGYYPFYDAMFLGGSENLRAYTRARYSGDASLFGQIELRSKLTELKIIMKGDFGFNLFAGTGRVFTQNNKSSVWHNSLGLGLWASYFNRKFVFNGSFAYSKEEYNFYVDMAMGF